MTVSFKITLSELAPRRYCTRVLPNCQLAILYEINCLLCVQVKSSVSCLLILEPPGSELRIRCQCQFILTSNSEVFTSTGQILRLQHAVLSEFRDGPFEMSNQQDYLSCLLVVVPDGRQKLRSMFQFVTGFLTS